MHCERDIEQVLWGYWVDSDGLSYCMKQIGDFPPLMHEPMPVI
jgi:hypothetical protein